MSANDDIDTGHALEVHRLLDEAFHGFQITPDRQDLKEELRTSLVSRVAELRARGVDATTAARQAFEDLGDVRAAIQDVDPDADLVVDPDVDPGGSRGAGAPAASAGGSPVAGAAHRDWVRESARHRVRPAPQFIVRAVLLGAAGLAALVVLAFSFGPLDLAAGVRILLMAGLALAAGAVTADALRQETTMNHPLPPGRAAGYGLGALLGVAGVGLGSLDLRGDAVGWLIAGGLLVVSAVAVLTFLIGTQTNRHKAWVLRMQAGQAPVGDRFTDDPAAAARFGIYTLVTWVVAGAAFAGLTLTIGWAWSWIALVAGFAAMMLVLARMLFRPE